MVPSSNSIHHDKPVFLPPWCRGGPLVTTSHMGLLSKKPLNSEQDMVFSFSWFSAFVAKSFYDNSLIMSHNSVSVSSFANIEIGHLASWSYFCQINIPKSEMKNWPIEAGILRNNHSGVFKENNWSFSLAVWLEEHRARRNEKQPSVQHSKGGADHWANWPTMPNFSPRLLARHYSTQVAQAVTAPRVLLRGALQTFLFLFWESSGGDLTTIFRGKTTRSRVQWIRQWMSMALNSKNNYCTNIWVKILRFISVFFPLLFSSPMNLIPLRIKRQTKNKRTQWLFFR